MDGGGSSLIVKRQTQNLPYLWTHCLSMWIEIQKWIHKTLMKRIKQNFRLCLLRAYNETLFSHRHSFNISRPKNIKSSKFFYFGWGALLFILLLFNSITIPHKKVLCISMISGWFLTVLQGNWAAYSQVFTLHFFCQKLYQRKSKYLLIRNFNHHIFLFSKLKNSYPYRECIHCREIVHRYRKCTVRLSAIRFRECTHGGRSAPQ